MGGKEKGVFSSCSNITVVKLPQSLRTIGHCCFSSCVSLVEVSIPSGVIEIGERAFYHCHSLQNIILPQGLQHLPWHVFCGCEALVSIELPLRIKTVGSGAISGCSSLVSVNFHELKELESIGGSAFARCALVKVHLAELPKLKKIGSKAFTECSSLVDFTFPPNVTIIKLQTLQYCSSLAYVKLPPSLQTLETRVFTNCLSTLRLEARDDISEALLRYIMSLNDGSFKIVNSEGAPFPAPPPTEESIIEDGGVISTEVSALYLLCNNLRGIYGNVMRCIDI